MRNLINNELISVIVPCYNVEKYLEKCVKSILNQTYTNLEIILIDDGATDNTPKICDELALTDSRIKVIHKSNGGVSVARNIGIEVAIGKYITFLDSDDWIESKSIELAYKELINKKVDLIVWGYSADFVDTYETLIANRIRALSGICEKNKDVSVLLDKNALGLLGYTWNKLYKIDVIRDRNISFNTNLSLYEDILFNSQYINYCNKIKFFDYIGTHYIQRGGETLGTKKYENIFELKLRGCAARENILNHFGVNEKTLSKVMGAFYFGALKSAVSNITLGNGATAQKIKKLRKFLSESTVQGVIKKVKNISSKQCLIFYLIKIKAVHILVYLKNIF